MINTFSEIIKQSANRHPDKDAFRCGNAAITYAEWETKTAQLAQYFIENGVKKGDRIGVYLNRCLDTAIAIYGIMQAGAIYVPLDTTAPTSRTCFLLKDCGIQYVVSNPTQRRKLQAIINEPIELKAIIGLSMDWPIPTISWETIFSNTGQFDPIRILEHDPAYIIYTSGSTGTPKGIIHTHHSGLAYAKLTVDLYQLNENDRIGNHAPLHFDISTLGYFSSPLVGATAILTPEAYTKLPASLSALIEKEKVTVWYSVPLALIQMLQRGTIENKDFSSLRWILFGGEPFPLKHLKKIMALLPKATFSNVYGPAEVNQCTYYNFKHLPDNEDNVPLGKVWDNTEVLIVNAKDQIILNDEIGELLVRSSTRMAGYWKQPELTQASLFERITETGINDVFYRTGDLVKMREDGNLIFIGREDRQIKTRGYRVELDEVEAVLLAHEAVQEAAVFVIQQEEEKKIEAALILKSQQSSKEGDLKKYMSLHLPPYAVPNNIQILKELPRTSTGKINRQVLKKQYYNTIK